MIISQHFDVEQDTAKGEKGKRGGRIMIDSCKETMTLRKSVNTFSQERSYRRRRHVSKRAKKKSLF